MRILFANILLTFPSRLYVLAKRLRWPTRQQIPERSSVALISKKIEMNCCRNGQVYCYSTATVLLLYSTGALQTHGRELEQVLSI